MNTKKAYLPTSFIDPLIDYLDERALNVLSLKAEMEGLQQQTRIAAEDFSRLFLQIAELDDAPALGLRIGKMAKPTNFGLVGYLLASCSTLGQALMRYGRFQALVLSNLNAKVRVQDDGVSHQWMANPSGDRLVNEFSAAIFIKLYQSLIGQQDAPVRVSFPFAKPKDATIYQALLGCPVVFESPAIEVVIPAHLLLKKISTRDAYLLKIFDQQANAMLMQGSGANADFDEFLKQLQQQLLTAMKSGDTRASHVADQMGFSLRSLYRKLSDNGHSYRSILADTRRRLAKRYLQDISLSPSDVTMLLGYSEQSAFIRAFKNWTGMTPGEYRQSL